ncbi:MAG: S-layer homology domain-containing protein [Candidatus Sericytochromatia bacterium]
MKNNKAHKLILSAILGVSLISSPILTNSSFAKTEDFKDLRADHWAYKAIKELVDKYDVMSGFPDGTFRGTRTFSRYEAAAALYKVMLKMEEALGKTPQPVIIQKTPDEPKQVVIQSNTMSSEDLKLIKDLRDEFRREIDALKFANADKDAKLKKLEDELNKVKQDFGKVKFSGGLDVGFDDTLEDTFRPEYYGNYTLSTKITVDDASSISAKYEGKFSSKETKKDDNGQSKKVTEEAASLGYAQAWFNYAPKGVIFNPIVKFGYMGANNLVSAGTSVGSLYPYGSSVWNANPNLGGKNRGIRGGKTVVAGVEGSSGALSAALAATPTLFLAQGKLDFGALKIKAVADADQSVFIGDVVKDSIHNETIIADLKTDNFGLGGQVSFRSVADEFSFKAASGVLNIKLGSLELGGSAKYQNDSIKSVIVGGFLKTPDKLGSLTLPVVTVALQEPLTVKDDGIYEGYPNLEQTAGLNISVTIDNPYIPGLSFYFDQSSKILFASDPKDILSTGYGVSSSVEF